MVISDAGLQYPCSMSFGGVSYVLIPSVLREFFMKCTHEFISIHFSEYRCGSNAFELGVTLYDACVRYERIRKESITIDQEMFRSDRERIKCTMHGLISGLKDIYPVDLMVVHFSDGKCDRLILDDLRKFLPRFFTELFAVIEERVSECGF